MGPLGVGCWRFVARPDDELRAVLEAGLDLGMNLVDTADIYGLGWGGQAFGEAEENLGRILAGAPGLRERMVLATKGGIVPGVPYNSGRDAITAACEASLRRLRTDVIDLYQIHRPDMLTHPAEMAEALSGLRTAGKIREVGVSNFTPRQHEALAAHLPFALATTQPEYSAAHLAPLRDGTLDLCMRDGVVPLAWSPLGGGRLADGSGARPDLLAVLDRLAAREGVDRAVVAVAFVLAHPAKPVALLGTQRPERLARLALATGLQLDRNDVYDVIEASEGARLP
ncbi:MAG: aldo/keto reductase [Acidimicrobiaceae bacterium]|nr:aldo/keto reductase [Acidimicrobiaceae bacterium]MXZ67231.1 aldo/keto reductase [Acidimicrobiaceae bacterium]MYE56902.1 aldo/keto reductase [Acidimicrobiaceae bacterium]MYE65749.1 aldo/keto reductase [Acidimicrobiaceae bacterium]MYF32546.1 aldo/keto reductase [Acidimicrobiaceae bacterium]